MNLSTLKNYELIQEKYLDDFDLLTKKEVLENNLFGAPNRSN